MKIKNNKGFTLIELLIVVAIIAILAAIAIPQFAQYRIKGYNSSALTDLRNARTTQEALFADFQRYGRSDNTAALPGSGAGAGVVMTGPGVPATPNLLTLTDAGGSIRGLQTPTGTGVTLVVAHDGTQSSFTGASKHQQGNVTYAADSDSTATYRGVVPSGIGLDVLPGDALAPVPDSDEYAALPAAWQTL